MGVIGKIILILLAAFGLFIVAFNIIFEIWVRRKLKEMDDFGITDRDIRRYKGCYVFENVTPDREYIKRMTGLDDIQIAELDRRVRENILKV